MSDFLRGLIDAGRRISDRACEDAMADAQGYRDELTRMVGEDAVIVTPAVDGLAPPIIEPGTGSPDLQALWTLAWLPVLAAPCGRVDGLPVGVQLVAAPRRDDLVLSAARVLGSAYPCDIVGL